MIVSAPLSAKEALRFRFRSPKRKSRGSSRSRSLDHRRPFQPQVNKSFTCYQEVQVPQPSRKNQSFSVERSRNISLGEIKPIRKAIVTGRHRIMKSTSKLDNGHPGPRELEDGLHRKEIISAVMDQGNAEMRSGQYTEAIKYFKRVLKEEPTHLDAMYNRAVSYMHIGQHKLAIPDLVTVARENPSYDRQLYIALAMCFIASNDYVTAVRQLTKGLIKFPKFSEGYITRGQLYNQQQRWDKALTDFYKAIALNPREGTAYVGLADSLIGLGDTKAALQVLNQAIHDQSCAPQALLKRSKIWLQFNDYEKGLKDIEAYIAKGGDNAEAYFNRGVVLEKLGQDVEAALSFEQAIKYDHQKLFVGQAIYKLGAIKIKQKDFYGAMYTFKRAIDAKIQIKEQTYLRQYAEAVLNLMKRKYKEGIHQLSKLIRKKPSQIKEYIGSCYAYRGFGYCANEQYEKALKDFNSAKKVGALDKASSYNKLLCEGILTGEKKDYAGATELFSRAERQFEKNVEPLAHKCMVIMCMLRETTNGKEKLIHEAKGFLDRAIVMRDTESDLYFFRGLLNYYLSKPVDAIPDFEMAIEKAEDNVPSHYIGRGLCYAALKLYKEAIQDFTIAIQLDENLSDAYFYRGRCAFILDDTSLAFLDFQKLILTNPVTFT